MVTILLVEDNQEVVDFVQLFLQHQGFLVVIAKTGSEASEKFSTKQPDLVILDLNLPDIRGENLCQEFKQIDSQVPIIMLTGQSEQTDVAAGLALGADDYLEKPFEGKELLARVKARLRNRGLESQTLQVADLELNTQTMLVKRAGQQIDLTPQEFKLLEYLMINANRVLSRDMILNRVWNTTPDIETRVVDVYIGYLRKKIDQLDPKLIHSVRGFGYVLREE